MLAKKTVKNQLTLPKNVVARFPGIDYFEVSIEDNRIVLSPVQMKSAVISLDSIREKIEKLGVSDQDVKEAIRRARSGRG